MALLLRLGRPTYIAARVGRNRFPSRTTQGTAGLPTRPAEAQTRPASWAAECACAPGKPGDYLCRSAPTKKPRDLSRGRRSSGQARGGPGGLQPKAQGEVLAARSHNGERYRQIGGTSRGKSGACVSPQFGTPTCPSRQPCPLAGPCAAALLSRRVGALLHAGGCVLARRVRRPAAHEVAGPPRDHGHATPLARVSA